MSQFRNQRRLQSRTGESSRRSRGGFRSFLVAAVAQLCLLAQGAVLGHLLLVPHSTCLEHGTVTHEASHEHPASEHVPSEAQPASQAGADRQTHALLDDQHCAAAGLHNAPVPQLLGASAANLKLEVDACAVPSAPEATSAPARYRVAPKNSPPRA